MMKTIRFCLIACLVGIGVPVLCAQENKDSSQSKDKSADKTSQPAAEDRSYSGMYSFRKDGEFLQLTVEDGGAVTGFISRYGDGESDKGAFLDQFFKTGKIDGSKLTFTTEIVHGVAFEFRGTAERGEGKNPADEAYFVLRGTLTEKVSDASKKVTSHSSPVVFKLFPQEAGPAPVVRQ